MTEPEKLVSSTSGVLGESIEQQKLNFEREKFHWFQEQVRRNEDFLRFNIYNSYRQSFIKLIIVVILVIVLVWYIYTYRKELFAPYASILAPDTINSIASFDLPDQYGQDPDPYKKEKQDSENKLFNQTTFGYPILPK